MSTKTLFQSAKAFFALNLDLIPLNGKIPHHHLWQTREYTHQQIKNLIQRGFNLGWRIPKDHIVLDVDIKYLPETWQEKELPEFLASLGIKNVDNYPQVNTGSGGLHIYFKIPDAFQHYSFKKYPAAQKGFEFKYYGQQVVIPGSIHPSTKQEYTWKNDLSSFFSGIHFAPESFFSIFDQTRLKEDTLDPLDGYGEWSSEDLAFFLNQFEPTDFPINDDDDWFQLMASCHYYTAGDGKEVFLDWASRNPAFSDEKTIVKNGYRWDSIHNKKDNNITGAFLQSLASRTGVSFSQPKTSKSDKPARTYTIEDAANEFARFTFGGKVSYIGINPEKQTFNQIFPYKEMRNYFSQYEAFESVKPKSGHVQQYEQIKQELKNAGAEDAKQLADVLAKHESVSFISFFDMFNKSNLKDYSTATYSTDDDLPSHIVNLWTGLVYKQPKKMFKITNILECIKRNFCQNNTEQFNYFINWMAHSVQYPTSPIGTALVLIGEQGSGKSLIGNKMLDIFGPRHGLCATNEETLKRFNNELAGKSFVLAEELIWGGEIKTANRWKSIITDRVISIEQKNTPIINMKNIIHLMATSNESHALHLDRDDRRYAVFECVKDFKYFDGVIRESAEDLYSYLVTRDISDFIPQHIPNTSQMPAKKAQILASLNSIYQFLGYVIASRLVDRGFVLDGKVHKETTKLSEHLEVRIIDVDFFDQYAKYCKDKGIKYPKNIAVFRKELKQVGLPVKQSYVYGEKQTLIFIPPIPELIKLAMEKNIIETDTTGQVVDTMIIEDFGDSV